MQVELGQHLAVEDEDGDVHLQGRRPVTGATTTYVLTPAQACLLAAELQSAALRARRARRTPDGTPG